MRRATDAPSGPGPRIDRVREPGENFGSLFRQEDQVFEAHAVTVLRLRIVETGLEGEDIPDRQDSLLLRMPLEARIFVQLEPYTVSEPVNIPAQSPGLGDRGRVAARR